MITLILLLIFFVIILIFPGKFHNERSTGWRGGSKMVVWKEPESISSHRHIDSTPAQQFIPRNNRVLSELLMHNKEYEGYIKSTGDMERQRPTPEEGRYIIKLPEHRKRKNYTIGGFKLCCHTSGYLLEFSQGLEVLMKLFPFPPTLLW